MKKVNYLLMSIFVIAATFVACDDNSDKYVETTIIMTENFSIEGTVSGATDVKIELKDREAVKAATTSGAYSFTGLEKKVYAVKATATGYIERNAIVELRTKTSQILDFAMIKASTQTKPINEVVSKEAETIITNDEFNQSESDAAAAIMISPATTITNESALPKGATFSVTAYMPAAATSEVPEGSKTEGVAVLALNCEPAGAQFSQPVILSADLNEKDIPAANMKLVDGWESKPVSLQGTVYSAPVTHFSTWTFQLEAPVTTSAAITETAKKTTYLKKGNNSVSYEEKCGYEIMDNPFATSKIVDAFIATRFGSKVRSVTKSFSAEVSTNGTLSYNIEQNYQMATITIGDKTISVKVYGTAPVETTGFKVGK